MILSELRSVKAMLTDSRHGEGCCEEKNPERKLAMDGAMADCSTMSHSVTSAKTSSGASSFGSYLESWGVAGSLIWSKSECHSTYSISFRSGLPFSSMFGQHIFVADVSIRRFPLCRSIPLLRQGGFGLRSVVSADSEIMVACRNGHLNLVRELFRSGRARPDDVTAENSTPLRVSISAMRPMTKALIAAVCH